MTPEEKAAKLAEITFPAHHQFRQAASGLYLLGRLDGIAECVAALRTDLNRPMWGETAEKLGINVADWLEKVMKEKKE